jgi:hypothetical protein
MKASEVDKIVRAARDNLYVCLSYLQDMQQHHAIERLMADTIGNFFASITPSKRKALKEFMDYVVDVLGDNIFEDDEDLESYLEREFNKDDSL